jgi:hypothetical protein
MMTSDDVIENLFGQEIDFWPPQLPPRIATRERLAERMRAAQVVERTWLNLVSARPQSFEQTLTAGDLAGFYGIEPPGDLFLRYRWGAGAQETGQVVLSDPTDLGPRLTVLAWMQPTGGGRLRVPSWGEVLVAHGRPLPETFRYSCWTLDVAARPDVPDCGRDTLLRCTEHLMIVQTAAAFTHLARGYVRAIDVPGFEPFGGSPA